MNAEVDSVELLYQKLKSFSLSLIFFVKYIRFSMASESVALE